MVSGWWVLGALVAGFYAGMAVLALLKVAPNGEGGPRLDVDPQFVDAIEAPDEESAAPR